MYPKLYVVTTTVSNVKIMIVGCMHAKLLKPICSKCTNANDEDASYEPHEENQHHMFLPEASMNREKKKTSLPPVEFTQMLGSEASEVRRNSLVPQKALTISGLGLVLLCFLGIC